MRISCPRPLVRGEVLASLGAPHGRRIRRCGRRGHWQWHRVGLRALEEAGSNDSVLGTQFRRCADRPTSCVASSVLHLRRIPHDCLAYPFAVVNEIVKVGSHIGCNLQSSVAIGARTGSRSLGNLPEWSERSWSYLNQVFESPTIQPRRCRSEFKTVMLSKCRHTAQLTTCCDPRCRSEHFGGTTANATTRAVTGQQPCLHTSSTNRAWS